MDTEVTTRGRNHLTVDEVIEGVFADDDSEQEIFSFSIRQIIFILVLQ